MPETHTDTNPTTTKDTFKVGDEVTVHSEFDPNIAHRYPGVWIVKKVPTGARGVNYVVDPKDGGRGLRIPGWSLRKHDPSTPAPTASAPAAVPYVPVPSPGTVVTVHGVRTIDPDTLMVVIGESRNGDAKIVELCSDTFSYWRVPARTLRKVTLDLGKVRDCIITD